MPITASMLYDYVHCPHRVTLDLFGDPALRDAPNKFVELLWEKGALHEERIMAKLEQAYVDCSGLAPGEAAAQTMQAMDNGVDLIYAGRLEADDLLGVPDLLRRSGDEYVAGDIKSGSGEEGPEDARKPKIHYGVQLALYTDLLERLGYSAGRQAFVIDRHGDEVDYDLMAPLGLKTRACLWDKYEEALAAARAIVMRTQPTSLALGSHCDLCHWHTKCRADGVATDDLTLIPSVGRAKRDVMLTRIPTVAALATCDPELFVEGKKTAFPGIGLDSLRTFAARATLLKDPAAGAYLKQPFIPPVGAVEIFFDIEDNPFDDICYLHGFLERPSGQTDETYTGFFATESSPDGERAAFAQAVAYLRQRPDCVLYHYSPHERTIWKRLQVRYPLICSEQEVAGFFTSDRAVDLYRIVASGSEWPTNSHSIKAIAKYLGFKWRDEDASGAASIEWFVRWVETRNDSLRTRLLEYNEDDCRATRVLLDALRVLPVRQ